MLLKCQSFYQEKLIDSDYISTLIILIVLCEEFQCEVNVRLYRIVWLKNSGGDGEGSLYNPLQT